MKRVISIRNLGKINIYQMLESEAIWWIDNDIGVPTMVLRMYAVMIIGID